jgi:hypothetical protein
MIIQAVLFNMDKYNIFTINQWFKDNKLECKSIYPIVNNSGGKKETLWRCRLYDPNQNSFEYTRVLLNDDISFMVQTTK